MSDIQHIIRTIEDDKTRPDLVIYMQEAEHVKTESIIKQFLDNGIKIPCICITDSDQDFLEEKLVNSGIVSQHLTKPVSLKEIINAINLSLS